MTLEFVSCVKFVAVQCETCCDLEFVSCVKFVAV